MKYRSTEEIINSILVAIGSGDTQTRIMYRAFLSYSQMTGYFDLLISRKLIFDDQISGLYKITERGQRFMQVYAEIDSMIHSEVEQRRRTPPQSMTPFNY